jgi:predicted dehydrogenase
MKTYGIGIVGLGMGASILEVNKVDSIPMQVRGVCSTTNDKARVYKEKYNLNVATIDYRKLVEDESIDIVAVLSPDYLHAEHCKLALQAGKHVICTKPMVTTLEDAKDLVDLVQENGLKFLIGQTMRYEPQFSTIKRMQDDGELGDIIMAEAHYVHDMRPVYEMTPWRLEAPQDFMYGGVSHPVDVLRWYCGDIVEVFAYGAKGNVEPRYPLMGNFLLNLKFANGIIGRVMGAYDIVHPPIPMMSVSLWGQRATVNGSFSDKLGGQIKIVHDKYDFHTESEMNFSPEIEGAYGHGQTVLRYLDHFSRVLEFDEEPIPDVVEGAKTIAVCSAAWESVKTGKPVAVFNDF